MSRIVPVGQAVTIVVRNSYPKNSTGRLSVTKKNNQVVELTSWRNRGTYCEFVVPGSLITEADTPLTVKCYVNDNVVKVEEIDVTHVAAPASTVIQYGLPAYAGTRTRPYDATRHVYGATDEIKQSVRAAMGHALAGSALVPILCVGDSETAGYRAAPGVDDPVIATRNQLKAAGFPITGSWIYPANGTTTDARVTFSGTWSGKTSTTSNYVYATAQNAYVQFAPDQTGTVVELTVFSTSTQNIDYSIDGATAVTVSCVAGAVRKFSVTGLSNSTHTIRVTKTAAGGTLWVGPARVRATTGVSVTNAGIFGALSSDWLPTAGSGVYFNPYNLSVALETPKIVIIGLGANEALNAGQGTPAQVTTRLTALVQAYQTLGSVVILKTYPSPADSIVTAANAGYVWADYAKAIYDVADAKGVMVIDHTAAMGSNTLQKAQGLAHSDSIHPLAPGYAVVGRRDAQALLLP